MSVLVLGAGELGTAMLKALTAHPSRPRDSPVSVLLRPSTITSSDPTKRGSLARIAALGVSVEAGDVVHDPVRDLARTFARHHTVISCTGFVGPAGTQRRICEAALLAGVRRFVPWQFGVDYDALGRGGPQPLFDEMLDVRDALRAQAEARTLRALGAWDVEVTLTEPGDIATMTAEVVYEPRGIPGGDGRNVVYVSGDTVSYGRAADLVERRFPGVGFAREVWDMEVLGENLARDPADAWNKYRAIFGAGRGISWPTGKTLNHERGIELEDPETYLGRMESPGIWDMSEFNR
ncbi:Isoflavone reductase-like protein TP7, partial [Colletotrichum shisoi]